MPGSSRLPILENFDNNETGESNRRHVLAPQATLSGDHPYQPTYNRRLSVSSTNSLRGQYSPSTGSVSNDDDTKGHCPHPDCGLAARDLKSHMLTHQSDRPEKCPIVSCEYHIKGFARQYDKKRHTLSHLKTILVCGFCPGSGSSSEKSFNRADAFKRHLSFVHGVECTPPNCQRKSSSTNNSMAYSSDATGKCSTCPGTFNNPQELYEHLDDCLLRDVQKEEPSDAIMNTAYQC